VARKPKAESTKEKADKAEARAAAKRAQIDKKAQAAQAASGSNSVDPKVKELFEHHLKKIQPIANRLKSVNGDLRSLYKTAKADGFTSQQFVLAMSVRNVDGTENAEGVEKLKERMRRDAATLLYIGSSVGTQFDMFAQEAAPSEDESINIAYLAGVRCSKADNPAKTTDYAPQSPQYQAFLKGFHDNEATKLAGMKKLPEVPTSGQPMTRAQFRAQQEAAQKGADETAH
jgi:hypothetical protein